MAPGVDPARFGTKINLKNLRHRLERDEDGDLHLVDQKGHPVSSGLATEPYSELKEGAGDYTALVAEA